MEIAVPVGEDRLVLREDGAIEIAVPVVGVGADRL